MAVTVRYNAYVEVNAVDLSDHVTRVAINDGQESRDATTHGDSARKFRAGLGTPAFDITFLNDPASGSVEGTLRALIGVTSTGFNLFVKTTNGTPSGASNPRYELVAVPDGDLMVMDDEVGEIASVSGRFVPYGAFSVITSSTT